MDVGFRGTFHLHALRALTLNGAKVHWLSSLSNLSIRLA